MVMCVRLLEWIKELNNFYILKPKVKITFQFLRLEPKILYIQNS